eukprot:363668-Chlamydomonas_euryale.AAC.1
MARGWVVHEHMTTRPAALEDMRSAAWRGQHAGGGDTVEGQGQGCDVWSHTVGACRQGRHRCRLTRPGGGGHAAGRHARRGALCVERAARALHVRSMCAAVKRFHSAAAHYSHSPVGKPTSLGSAWPCIFCTTQHFPHSVLASPLGSLALHGLAPFA